MNTAGSKHLDLLERVKLFEGIPRERILPVLAPCPLRRLGTGDVLIEPGRENHDLFVLLDGGLQVRLESAVSEFGFAIEAGEFAGEMSVIDGQRTTAYVVADRPSLVLDIHDTVLWQQLGPVPGVIRNLLRLVSERLRARNQAMFEAQKRRLQLEELERELANARNIQINMLPQRSPLFSDQTRLDVHALMEPAKEVGGDFYDAFMLDPMHACIVVGDVSGKGMPAALFMVRALTLLRAEAHNEHAIERIVAHLNDALSQDNPSCMFVTLCMVAVNIETGAATIVSGGHDAPLARLQNGEWQYLPKPAGPLVGVMPGAAFATHAVQMQPGDTILLYTDGVTEAENPRQEQYSAARLRDDLNRNSPGNASAVVNGIRLRVSEFAAGGVQSDDITIVALRFTA